MILNYAPDSHSSSCPQTTGRIHVIPFYPQGRIGNKSKTDGDGRCANRKRDSGFRPDAEAIIKPSSVLAELEKSPSAFTMPKPTLSCGLFSRHSNPPGWPAKLQCSVGLRNRSTAKRQCLRTSAITINTTSEGGQGRAVMIPTNRARLNRPASEWRFISLLFNKLRRASAQHGDVFKIFSDRI